MSPLEADFDRDELSTGHGFLLSSLPMCASKTAARAGQEETDSGSLFQGNGLHGEVAEGFENLDALAEARWLIDPAHAIETIHWGRNYLYTAHFRNGGDDAELVVKQFRNQGWFKRLERKWRGSKAERSWRVAQELIRTGFNTPQPVMLVESDDPEGPSFFIAKKLDRAAEIRQFFRRLTQAEDAGYFPDVDAEEFLRRLGRYARRLHDAGIVYRDLSLGNILAVDDVGEVSLWLVDFNRARTNRRPGLYRRTRDICRLPIVERPHRKVFLEGYWGETPGRLSPRWWLYTASVRGYILKHQIKGTLRARRTPRGGSHGSQHHAHIPAVDKDASARDKAVWDHLSDQPHQHAGRFEKMSIRLADAGSHLHDFALVLSAVPRVWRRYKAIMEDLHSQPVTWSGAGLCLRPWDDDPERQLRLLDELGLRRAMIRLHPWEDNHDREEEFARQLHQRGVDLSFALPQNRDLVRDQCRWRSVVRELGQRFRTYGNQFQIGQAVNRSKWGIWTRSEYVRLFEDAARALENLPDVELLGPAVIDFEHQVTAAIVNRRADHLHFDVVSSLLYVDRRGAPENRQLGFDTIGKIALLKAIAETGRCSEGRCWITEVNWPLWEGPHSPAGRTVSVDEESQANYLVRYYLLALGSGLVERVYWWRLIARGYGLVAPATDGSLRARPAFQAFKTINRLLEGSRFLGPLTSDDGVYLYRFERAENELVVGWTVSGDRQIELPFAPVECIGRDGEPMFEAETMRGMQVIVQPQPRYFLAPRAGETTTNDND